MSTTSTTLPQLSSYLPSSSLGTFLRDIPTISFATNSLKANQGPVDAATDVDLLFKEPSSSGSNSTYQAHGQVSPLLISKGSVLSSTCTPFARDGDKLDVETPRFFASQQTTPRRERTSRYLSEGDRQEIITRIDGGEKQVTLAREFSVSRAAICSLYKNRWEVLTRGSRNLELKHPKKSCGQRSRPRFARPYTAKDEAITVVPDMSTISICTDEGLCDAFENSISNLSGVAAKGKNKQPAVKGEHFKYHQLHYHHPVSDQRSPAHEAVNGPARSSSFLVHEASAYSYPCRSLIATLRDENISTVVFQQRFTRLVRLLIEEALTCLPHEDVKITNRFGDTCHIAKSRNERDICGVSMENKGMVLLSVFSTISPLSSTGVVSVAVKGADNNSINNVCSPDIHAQLPLVSSRQVVLLLDYQCTTGNEACAVLHYLVHERNISAKRIYFVTVISSFEGLRNVFWHFPGGS
ncbi:unnamed protein product [Peronospora belbahrii]|uniref:Phosphoribosyltransferase domain-containing protein n=2 Tax=Peronospora belbahrii TaxID=622444 RepID=A0AAU9KRI4_9STRA|nr:unnamed protein product [Peronospora belbahrii]